MKTHKRYAFEFAFLIVALVLSLLISTNLTSAGAAPVSTVSVTLTSDQTSLRADQAVIIHVTMTNTGTLPVRLLKWHTPVDGVNESLFAVTRGGVEVLYVGKLYKRPAPTAADYITLLPGESLVRDVNLADYYDLSKTGDYAIHYETASWNLFTENSSYRPEAIDSLSSNSVAVRIEGRPAPNHQTPPALETVSGTTSFNQCTSTEQSSLINARAQAGTYAGHAYAYLQAGTVGSLYTTWFGAYDATRYATVRTHFSTISNAMDTAAVKFDCTCNNSAYAYVYPNSPYNIYLCNAFWSAPMAGTDSKGGTLIHEMSHFYVVASTNDWVYGQTAAKQLASSNPAHAITNADNHEYFAEDSPSSSSTQTPTATKISTPTRTPTSTKTPLPASAILVNPTLSPAPGRVCSTDWYKVARGGFKNSSLYLALNVHNSVDSHNSGKWTPNIPTSGRYLVEAYIGHHNSVQWSCPSKILSLNTSDARYNIFYSGGNVTVSVDQSPLDRAWANLGVYTFTAGKSGYVTLTDLTGDADLSRLIAFNVVRFTWVGP